MACDSQLLHPKVKSARIYFENVSSTTLTGNPTFHMVQQQLDMFGDHFVQLIFANRTVFEPVEENRRGHQKPGCAVTALKREMIQKRLLQWTQILCRAE